MTFAELMSAVTQARGLLGVEQVAQRDLKALAVMTVDQLANGMAPKQELWMCANRCTNIDLSHASPYKYECMLDVHLMRGRADPYETCITAEAEGYPGHYRHLAQSSGKKKDMENDDPLWDLFKLLAVPSPLRLFFALGSTRHWARVAEAFSDFADKYRERWKEGDLWLVYVPTAHLASESVRVMHWPRDDEGQAKEFDFKALFGA